LRASSFSAGANQVFGDGHCAVDLELRKPGRAEGPARNLEVGMGVVGPGRRQPAATRTGGRPSPAVSGVTVGWSV
jgi:hypothetical protein